MKGKRQPQSLYLVLIGSCAHYTCDLLWQRRVAWDADNVVPGTTATSYPSWSCQELVIWIILLLLCSPLSSGFGPTFYSKLHLLRAIVNFSLLFGFFYSGRFVHVWITDLLSDEAPVSSPSSSVGHCLTNVISYFIPPLLPYWMVCSVQNYSVNVYMNNLFALMMNLIYIMTSISA